MGSLGTIHDTTFRAVQIVQNGTVQLQASEQWARGVLNKGLSALFPWLSSACHVQSTVIGLGDPNLRILRPIEGSAAGAHVRRPESTFAERRTWASHGAGHCRLKSTEFMCRGSEHSLLSSGQLSNNCNIML